MSQEIGQYTTISNNEGESGVTRLTATARGANTGRNTKYDDYVGTTTSGASSTLRVIQPAKAEFVEFDADSVTVANNVTQVTITGKSNSSKLHFTPAVLVESDMVIVSPYTAVTENGHGSYVTPSPENNGALQGDPGAVEQYTFEVIVQFPANGGTVTMVRTLNAETNNGSTDSITINQLGQTSTIHFEDTQGNTITQIALASDLAGATVDFDVVSNDSWTLDFDN